MPRGQCLPSQLAQRTHRGDGMVAASGRKPPGLGCGHRSTPRCLKLSLCPQNASFQPVPCCWKGHCCSGCCLCPGGAGGTPWCRRGGLGAVQLAGSQRRVSHLSLRGAKCRQSRCGGRPFAPTPPRCQGRPEVPGGRGGGPRWVAQLLPPPHPQRPPRCARWAPAGCRRGARGKQTWASWAGRGVPAPFEAPIKEPSIKGGESQRNKESG